MYRNWLYAGDSDELFLSLESACLAKLLHESFAGRVIDVDFGACFLDTHALLSQGDEQTSLGIRDVVVLLAFTHK